MIVFDASAVVSAALREDSVPERALLRAEEIEVFALSDEVEAEIVWPVLGSAAWDGVAAASALPLAKLLLATL